MLSGFHEILKQNGVIAYSLIDWDGLVIFEEGNLPNSLAPIFVQLLKVWNGERIENWREVHFQDKSFLIKFGSKGILIVYGRNDMNLAMLRIISEIEYDNFEKKLESRFSNF